MVRGHDFASPVGNLTCSRIIVNTFDTSMDRPVVLLALFAASTGAVRAQVDVLTVNYDNNRTVNPTQFGKFYAYPVDGQLYVNMPGGPAERALRGHHAQQRVRVRRVNRVFLTHATVRASSADRISSLPEPLHRSPYRRCCSIRVPGAMLNYMASRPDGQHWEAIASRSTGEKP